MKTTLLVLLTTLFISCASHKDAVNFEKITFHSSRCFGSCPVINLQLNKDKSLYLSKQEFTLRHKVSGNENAGQESELDYFKGTVSDKLYSELLEELAKTDTVSFKGQNCCDAPLKTFTAYYNGKRKHIETMFPPEEAKKLIEVLYEISKSGGLEKTTEKFEIE